MYNITVKKTLLISIIILLFSQVNQIAAQNQKIDSSYFREIENWDKQRERNLRSENGWLNIIGLNWLNEGVNFIGSDTSCSIQLPNERCEKILGNFILKNGNVSFVSADNVAITNDGKVFKSGVVYTDTMTAPIILSYKQFKWFIIKRGLKYGVRLRDLECQALKDFKGINRFPITEEWKIIADLIPNESKLNLGIRDVIGNTTQTEIAGSLNFTFNNIKYSLLATREDDKLFIVFADETSGISTYVAGRFLYANIPTSDNKIILDFNKAYNPPCAFTNYATCPLPLPQNVIKIAITAGEKSYGNH